MGADILGGGTGSGGVGSDFTSQGGLTGGIGGGGVIGPISGGGLPANIQDILNSSGGGGAPPQAGPAGGPGGFEGIGGGGTIGGIGGGFGLPGGIPSGGAAFEPNQQLGLTGSVVPPLSQPPGFNAEGGIGATALGGGLGQDFRVEQSQTQTRLAPEQGPGLEQAIKAALQLAGQQLDPSSQLMEFLAGPGTDLFGGGQDFLGGIREAQQGLNALEDPSVVSDRIGALGTDIQTQLREAIGGAGGIQTQGALSGNLGGGRGDVREGIATRGAIDAFARESAGIRESAAGRRLQGLLGGAQAGQVGLEGSQGLFNLGLSPSTAEFGPLAALSGIIGDPKVLTETLQQALAQGVTAGEGVGSTLGGVGGLLGGIGDLAAVFK